MSESQPPESSAAPTETPAPALPIESRTERFGRYGHRARLYGRTVVLVALLVILVVLISVNTRGVKLSWAFGSTKASLVWIILASTLIGWLLGITTATLFRRRTRRSGDRLGHARDAPKQPR